MNSLSVGFVPFFALGDHVINFLVGQFREHGQTDAGGRILLGIGQGSDDTRILAPRITRLLVNGDGVMRFRIHTVFDQPIDEFVAFLGVLHFNDVQVPHMAVSRLVIGQVKRFGARQAGGIPVRQLDAVVVPLVDVFQLGAKDPGVNIVQTAVEPEAVNVTGGGPVAAEQAGLGVDGVVIRDDGAAITEGAKILLDDEAGRDGIAQLADLEGVASSVNRLGIVFNDDQLVLVGDLLDGRHVGALTIQVHGDEAFGLGGDGRLDLRGINAFGFGVAIDQHGGCPGDPDGFRGGEKSVGVGNDFITFADAEGHEGQPDGIRAVTDTDGVLGAAERCEFLLELLVHGALNILAALDDLLDIGVDFRLDIVVLAHVTVEWNVHFFFFLCLLFVT